MNNVWSRAEETIRGAWAIRGVWLGLLAAGLAGWGEALLFQEPLRLRGAELLALGIALGVVAWGRSPRTAILAPGTEARWWAIAWRRGILLRIVGIATSAGLATGGVAANIAQPDAIFGLQGALWLASMALLLLSCAHWYPRNAPMPGRAYGAELGPPWTRAEIALFVGLVAFTLVTRLAYLDEIPWRFHFDEGFAWTEIMRYYQGPPIPLFSTTWQGTSLPSLLFALEAGLMHLTGVGLLGVRLGVALFGAFLVIPVYGIGRLIGGRTAAGVSAFTVACSAVLIHYSRVSIPNMTTPFFWAVCFYFLLRGLLSRRPGDFVWAGLAAGLSMYTYYGTRLLPYLLLTFGAYLLVFHLRATRERLGHLALVAIGFFAGFGPLLGFFMLNPTMWVGRGLNQLIIPPTIPTTWTGWANDWNVLAPLAWQDFLGLSVIPGNDTVYYAPFLAAPEAALLVMGVGMLIWRWRQPAAFLLLTAGLGVVFTGGLLLDATTIPNFAHWSPAFPLFFLALALPLAYWLRSLQRLDRRVWVAGCVLVAMGLLADAALNIHFYLVDYPPMVPPDKSIEAIQGRFLESLGTGVSVHIPGPTSHGLLAETDSAVAPHTPAANLLNPSRELPLVGDPSHDPVFLLYPEQWPLLPVLQSYYPGGQVTTVTAPGVQQAALSYRVPAAVAMSAYGARLQVTTVGLRGPTATGVGGPTEWLGTVPIAGALPTTAVLKYPAVATWTGAFYVDQAGPITIQVRGGSVRLWADGSPVDANVPFAAEPGWMRFQMQTDLAGPATRQLILQEAAAPPTEVDTAHLWPVAADQGLAVTLAGDPPHRRIDPFVSAHWLQQAPFNDPGQLPLGIVLGGTTQIRWEGEVAAPLTGTYTMDLRAQEGVRLVIDGQPVVSHCSPEAPLQGAIPLTAGGHHVRLDLWATAAGVEWLWTRPDGITEVVPPSALRLGTGSTPGAPINWPEAPLQVPCSPP